MVDIQALPQCILPIENLQSFAQVLQYRAKHTPYAEAFTFYNENRRNDEVSIDYVTLDCRAKQIAGKLLQHTIPGDRCLLVYQPSVEYIAAFFACLYAKVIAVPVFIPNLGGLKGNIDKLQRVLNDCSGKVVLSLREHNEITNQLLNTDALKFICLFSDEFLEEDCLYSQPEKWDSDEIAFLQYTSGSTDRPKGVKITHKNLITNTTIISKQFKFQDDSKGVIWLPPYHDMGLIGGVLASILGGIKLVLTPPITFIQNPLQWLNLISKHRGTISGGPNFAYDLCVKKMKKRPLKDLDLSSWKVAFCGAEPIQPETIKRFIETFEPYGFNKDAFVPCYGLAESTLMVSCKISNDKPMIRSLNADKFNRNIVDMAVENVRGGITEIVSCGEVISEHQISIVDPITRMMINGNDVGEIWVKGNSVAKGYWGNNKENYDTFNAKLVGDSSNEVWLRTGDLGYLFESEIFITGRLKELIIIHGLNYYPHDIELSVNGAHDSINASVAFGVTCNQHEELIIVLEISNEYVNTDLSYIGKIVRKAISDKFSLHIREIVCVRQKSIPRTTSGKLQRNLSKMYYLNERFNVLLSDKYFTNMSAISLSNECVDEEGVGSYIASYLGISVEQLHFYGSLTELGLDSIQLIELKSNIEEHFNIMLDTHFFLDNSSLSSFIQELVKKSNEQKFSVESTLKFGDLVPLNPTQTALWLMYQIEPRSSIYNVARCFKIDGQLDQVHFVKAIEMLVEEQVNLRTTFQVHNDASFQKIHDKILPGTVIVEDVQHLNNTHLMTRIQALASKPFILEQGPLLKIYIFITSLKENILLFVAHHIIIDFWSLNIFYKRINELYKELKRNGLVTSPIIDTYQSCINYNEWYNTYFQSEQYTHDLNFWLKQCESIKDSNSAPNIIKNTMPTFNLFDFSFSKKQTLLLKEFCSQNKITSFNLTLSIFMILLSFMNKEKEVIIGIPFALRDFFGSSSFIGYCVNLLPLHLEINDNLTLLTCVEKVKNLLSLMLKHKNFPFLHLVEKAGLPRRMDNRLPLFHALFLYQSSQHFDEALSLCALNVNETTINLDDIELNLQTILPADDQIEITLNVTPYEKEMRFVIQYESTLYTSSQMHSFANAYITIFELLINQQQHALSYLTDNSNLNQLLFEISSGLSKDENKKDESKNNVRYIEWEEKLIVLWRKILNKDDISNQDNFFACGGTSLLAIKLATEIKESFGISFDVRSIFRYQTLASLAEYIADHAVCDFYKSVGIKPLKRMTYEQMKKEKQD